MSCCCTEIIFNGDDDDGEEGESKKQGDYDEVRSKEKRDEREEQSGNEVQLFPSSLPFLYSSCLTHSLLTFFCVRFVIEGSSCSSIKDSLPLSPSLTHIPY